MSKRALEETTTPTGFLATNDANPVTKKNLKTEEAKVPIKTGLYVVYSGQKYAFDPTNLLVGSVRQQKMGKKADFSYRLRYANGTSKDISPVVLQTEELKTQFGFSTYKHSSGEGRTKLSLDARFSDPDSAILATLRATDAHILKIIAERMDEFVAAKKKSPEMVELMYNSLIRQNEKDGTVYDPSISFKISSAEEGGIIAARVKAFTKDSSKGSFEEIEITEVGKGATYRGVVSFEAIYVTPQSITPKLRLDQVQKLSDGVATGFAFVDEPVVVA